MGDEDPRGKLAATKSAGTKEEANFRGTRDQNTDSPGQLPSVTNPGQLSGIRGFGIRDFVVGEKTVPFHTTSRGYDGKGIKPNNGRWPKGISIVD